LRQRGAVSVFVAPNATGPVTYHGGIVQTQPSIYVVFWGFHAAGADPDGVAARMQAFLRHVGGSAWLHTAAQYYQMPGHKHVTNPPNQLKGVWFDDAHPIPPNLDGATGMARLAKEVQQLGKHFASHDVNAAYVIAIPHGHGGFPTGGCAYHGLQMKGLFYPAVVIPYMPDAGAGCGAGKVTGSPLDGVTIALGHELAETQTDPEGGAWYNGDYEEIADICAWQDLANTSFGGVSFPTQPLWSNASGTCVQ
jgi:hypothetical protein